MGLADARTTWGLGPTWSEAHTLEAESHAGECLVGLQPLRYNDPVQHNTWALDCFHSLSLRTAHADMNWEAPCRRSFPCTTV